MMPGVKFAEIAQALADAFDSFELARMLREEMSVRLDRIVGGGPFDQIIFNLVSWAERTGRDVELVGAAYRVNPTNEKVRVIYQKFGLAPAWEIQTAGVSQTSPTPPIAGGPEKTVQPYFPDLDVELWRTKMAVLESQVCRVELGNRNNYMGTGFLVGQEAVLTNHHVLASVIAQKDLPGQVRFRFDAKRLSDGTPSDGVTVGLHPTDWLLDFSPMTSSEASFCPDAQLPTPDELDYALVRLAEPIGRGTVGRQASGEGKHRNWLSVRDLNPPITPHMPLLILQHPSQGPLVLAIDTDGVIQVNENGTRVRYRTNTKNGSSGSPCFNILWGLLALHHYGDPVWKLIGKWNQGVPIGMIAKRIEKNKMAVAFLGDPVV
jgi:hypothetical protein